MSVRLHALKSIAREVQQVHELVAHYALAHPRVAFSCTTTADVYSLRLSVPTSGNVCHWSSGVSWRPRCSPYTGKVSICTYKEQ